MSHTLGVTKQRGSCRHVFGWLQQTAPTPTVIPAPLPACLQPFQCTLQCTGPHAHPEHSSSSACTQNMLDIHPWNKSLPQDLCTVLATPGTHTHSTCAHLYQLLRSCLAASGVSPEGCACVPVRALPWSRKVPAAETQHHLEIYCIWLFPVHHHQRGN